MSQGFSGGEKLLAKLKGILKQVEKNGIVKTGFFEDSKENKSGLPTAFVALMNEYGGSVVSSKGGNYYRLPRPFFRRMIKMGEKHWGEDLGSYLKKYGFSVNLALEALGQQMEDELKQSIADRVYAPLAPSTVARKGNDQTLIDSGDMQNAARSEVEMQ